MYNPNKPHKWEYDYTFSKHMCLFSIYLKKRNLPNKDENAPNLETLIISMCKQYKNKGYLFAMDNFYIMIDIFDDIE